MYKVIWTAEEIEFHSGLDKDHVILRNNEYTRKSVKFA